MAAGALEAPWLLCPCCPPPPPPPGRRCCSFWQRHLPAAAPNPLLPPPPHSAPPAAMASIFKLLDALPRHFGALAPNAAAAESALDVADLLKDLLNDAGPSCIAGADAAGLERCN